MIETIRRLLDFSGRCRKDLLCAFGYGVLYSVSEVIPVLAIVVALALVGVLTYWVVSQQLDTAGADVTTSNLDSGPGLGHTALRPVPVGGPDVAVGTANTEVGGTALTGPGTGSAALGGSA